MNIGDRVGVIAGRLENGVLLLLGFGKYVGDFVPGPEAIGSLADGIRAKGKKNPKIVLENGDVVWGCEVWWGAADRIQDVVADYLVEGGRVEEGRMPEIRAKFNEEVRRLG